MAEWLLARTTALDDRAVVLGDLEEEFQTRTSMGRSAARRWYWRQTVRSLVPNLRRRFLPLSIEDLPRKDHLMTSVGHDVRFALRMLRRRPLITGVVVLSLAVGIGLSVGVFSLLEAAVLRPLPLADPGSLRVVLEQRERSTNHNFTYPGFAAFRAVQQSFTDLVAFDVTTAALARPDGSDAIAGELVSGSYFSTLGPRLAMGRGLTDADMDPGAAQVVVLSHAEWQRGFGPETALAGQAVRLNGRDFAVVGVAASGFRGMFVGRDARFWAPLAAQPVLAPAGGESLLTLPTASWLTVLGRLRPGTTDAQAEAELNATGRSLTQERPDAPRSRFFVAPGERGDSDLAAQVAEPLQVLLGASLLVLVVACANVAGLLLARTGDRGRELAVRAALGAGRWRIARLLLIEAVVLGTVGTGAGLVAALWAAPLTVSWFAQFGNPITLDVGLNWRVLAFATGLGLVTAVAAGLAPVMRSWRRGAGRWLHEGGRQSTTGAAASRWRRGLVVAQFALTLGLVATAGLLVRTLVNLQGIPTGLDVDHVALVSLDPQAVQYDAARVRGYLTRVTERVSALPGVTAAGYGRVIPLGFGGSRMTVQVPGYEPAPDEDMELNYNAVSAGYFEALDIDILDGRALDERDRRGRPLAVVVNETMARRFWAGRAVGRSLTLDAGAVTLEIVGVARDVKYRTIREAPRPSFYVSVMQVQIGPVRGGIIHVRTAGNPADMLDTIRRAVAEVDPTVPVTQVRTLREQLSLNVNSERVTMIIGVSLGATALLLSAVGLFGTMANLVSGRARELGVRLALGAVPGTLARLVLGDGLRLAAWGGLGGLALAFWIGRAVESRLYGVGPFDPVSLAGTLALLAGVALLAAWLPARRAARVDPVQALRVE